MSSFRCFVKREFCSVPNMVASVVEGSPGDLLQGVYSTEMVYDFANSSLMVTLRGMAGSHCISKSLFLGTNLVVSTHEGSPTEY